MRPIAALEVKRRCFSALQRAEKSSIHRKRYLRDRPRRFSALQRAENSSIYAARSTASARTVSVLFSEPKIPQCVPTSQPAARPFRFSALQRAENSSMRLEAAFRSAIAGFQCSSASRKFLNCVQRTFANSDERVSVLFSEPKIPQWEYIDVCLVSLLGFSALQRAENSSMSRRSAA